MAFISVPEERFITDLMKTWLQYFSKDPDFSKVHITPRQPDVDKDFSLPSLCIRLIGSGNWNTTRLSGYHGYRPTSLTDTTIGRLMGYTYFASYQLDMLAKWRWELDNYVAIINKKLKAFDWSDVFADKGWAVQTVIPLLDFDSPQSSIGWPTDLRIRFRFWRDVDQVDMPAFDTELHQYSITVSFWIDYLKEYELPKIMSIDENITLI